VVKENLANLRAVLLRLRGFLRSEGETLEWRGPPGLLSAADREVIARARSEVVIALREGPVGGGICTRTGPDQPDQQSGDPTEPILAGPYSGFLTSPADRKPDPLRAATAVLEAVAWRLETHRRDASRRQAQAKRDVDPKRRPERAGLNSLHPSRFARS
jgi:hypothetical protein